MSTDLCKCVLPSQKLPISNGSFHFSFNFVVNGIGVGSFGLVVLLLNVLCLCCCWFRFGCFVC